MHRHGNYEKPDEPKAIAPPGFAEPETLVNFAGAPEVPVKLVNRNAHSEKQHPVTAGWIYVLVNSGLPELVKIGSTTRTVDERILELSRATGVPTRYICAYKFAVADPLAAEIRIHEALAKHRYNDDREFFLMSATDAIDAIRSILQ